MAEKNEHKNSAASLNGESDLEGKTIIDSTGAVIGKCKSVVIDERGEIGLVFEIEINGKEIVPAKTIPYSAIGKITDVIELRAPLNIKIAHSAEELKGEVKEKEGPQEDISLKVKEIEVPEVKLPTEKETETGRKEDAEEKAEEEEDEKGGSNEKEILEHIEGEKVETPQANATEQLSKALEMTTEGEEGIEPVQITTIAQVTTSKTEKEPQKFSLPQITQLMEGLKESIKKLDQLFALLSNGTTEEKIEAIKALTSLAEISPELGLSLLPKMMKLSDEQHQDVRLAVAQELEVLAEKVPQLFKGYFLEIFENIYDEPIEGIRDYLAKALYNIAVKKPEIASEGLETFFEEVMVGKRVPEVPSKIIHDVTLKVVSGNFQLARIAIKVRLKFIAKGGKLANRCIEELEDYNATLIGLAIIESFDVEKAEKLVNSSIFKKLGPIFVEVIQKMISAYKEGSLKNLVEVVDTKIEIPPAVIERFYEIKVNKTLKGIKNIPLEVFIENDIISPEETEQIIYRLIVQKKINAAITMNNGKTFITSLEVIDEAKKQPEKSTTQKEKPKTTSKKKATTTTSSHKKQVKKKTTSKSGTKTPATTGTKKSTETIKKKDSQSKTPKAKKET